MERAGAIALLDVARRLSYELLEEWRLRDHEAAQCRGQVLSLPTVSGNGVAGRVAPIVRHLHVLAGGYTWVDPVTVILNAEEV